MEYTREINLLLEAAVYLGNRANTYKTINMEERLKARNISDLEEFQEQYQPLKKLIQTMDREIKIPKKSMEKIFKEFPGFPFNSIGGYSPGFILLYPGEEPFDKDLDEFLHKKRTMNREEIYRNLLMAIDFKDEVKETDGGFADLFLKKVTEMDLQPEVKLGILQLQPRYEEYLEEMGKLLRPVLNFLQDHIDELNTIAEPFFQRLTNPESEAYVKETAGLTDDGKSEVEIIPLVLGPDTNVLVEPMGQDKGYVYAGVLRDLLKKLMYSKIMTADNAFDRVKLLGDRTRFDILLLLRENDAYASELADQMQLARNTIHHHMTRLIDADLVTPILDGNKVIYSLNKDRMGDLLDKLHTFLIGK
ncbi:MAG: winged helix-turn-helix domain-containing protein [Tissierellia bacterium]|nr:winged helix-turn-helix domain-containing protein [Tissierellia bacterium]